MQNLMPARKKEKLPLLRPWKSESNPYPGNGWSVFFGWMKYTFIPAILFSTTSGLFMIGYHQNPRILIGIAAFLIVALLSDTIFIYRSRKKLTKECLGFAVCALAIAAGAVCGTSIHLFHLLDYWPYYQMRHYTNVAPDEPAASKADASVIVFMEGARPDSSRSIKYRRQGDNYCVAAIAIESGYADDQPPSTDIQYWAIGKNCCGGHKGFTCDDAENPKARSGLVMQELSGDDLIGQGVMSSDEMTFYEEAVKMSLVKFDLTSPKERLYVRFVQDIDKARTAYWTTAMMSYFKYNFFWLLAFMGAGAFTVVIGAGDPEDDDGYAKHLGDAKQSTLWKLNHFM